jgi:hypothetical protein
MDISEKIERKPYNPYHLAAGYAAATLPDAKTAAVFDRLSAHCDYLGGSISVSVDTLAKETRLSSRSVNYAIERLKKLGRVSKKARGIGGNRGGRMSSMTTIYCTEEELRKAGATDENYFDRGGFSGLLNTQNDENSKRKIGRFKTQNDDGQSAKPKYSKRSSDGFKTQGFCAGTFPSLTLGGKPRQEEPPQDSLPASLLQIPQEGKKDHTLLSPPQGNEAAAPPNVDVQYVLSEELAYVFAEGRGIARSMSPSEFRSWLPACKDIVALVLRGSGEGAERLLSCVRWAFADEFWSERLAGRPPAALLKYLSNDSENSLWSQFLAEYREPEPPLPPRKPDCPNHCDDLRRTLQRIKDRSPCGYHWESCQCWHCVEGAKEPENLYVEPKLAHENSKKESPLVNEIYQESDIDMDGDAEE